MEGASSVAEINKGSRRKVNKGRKRQQERDEKYKDKIPFGGNFDIACQHKTPSSFQCNNINEGVIVRNRKLFYKNEGKTKQDSYICRLICCFTPQRKRFFSNSCQSKQRKFSTNYYIQGKNNHRVRVCKTFFMKAFTLGRKRLNSICHTIQNGGCPKENRGGDRKSHKNAAKKKSVCDFINRLPARESHYSRKKSCRVYLSCDLNISKLWALYNNSVDDNLKVKKWLFRHIFRTQFNVGFSTPATDVCTTCTFLTNQIKAETDLQKKQHHMTEKRIHKSRANAFYELIKEKHDHTYSLCFDLQQILPLPKTPIQDSFYSRQISFYNFCVVNVEGQNPHFYCWTENMAGRGSAEIGSALLNHLNTIKNNGTLEEVKCIRMFCDGCGGQNKNSFIIDALMYWLNKESPTSLKDIWIVYPVRGHSFLPADRIFGCIEKDLRKIPVITTRDHYNEILSRHGSVHTLGEDWTYYDIKSLGKYFKKIDGMRDIKRINIKKIQHQNTLGVVVKTYNCFKYQSAQENKEHNLLKRTANFRNINLPTKPLRNYIEGAKKKDVEKLLSKQFGENWKNEPTLKWYKDILYEENIKVNTDYDDNMDCDCIEPDCNEKHI